MYAKCVNVLYYRLQSLKLMATKRLEDWNPKFDKFFEEHEQRKDAGEQLVDYIDHHNLTKK